MQIRNIILTIFTSTLLGADAVQFSPDALDGIYAVITDANGIDQLQLIEDMGPVGPGILSKRESLGCLGRSMVPEETDIATSVKIGSSYAFMCDYKGGQLCYASEDAQANERLTANCGRYKAGWYHDNQKTYGYDYSWDGWVRVCENM
ncbi:hypothetical protein QBC37DRAFT_466823 [Rhypophila decipiens]|uniref:Uncharacterized protein n=1 Tax=Rhypophila decipiens TaxID=261697 RepID=A0AAN6Y5V5_9PEZI|nr:hypothetical protein QBC37DRAFT_466823 [Rhypophila decipiens]